MRRSLIMYVNIIPGIIIPTERLKTSEIIWKAVDVFLGSVGVPAMCYFLPEICNICTAVGAAQIGLHGLGLV